MKKILDVIPRSLFCRSFIVLTVALALCLMVLERYQLVGAFNMLPGDRYDAVISTTILEHWFNFFSGKVSWMEVGYYYPYTNTISQTDAYFLVGLAYAPFRFFGLDPFLSHELAGLTVKSAGFLGAYFLSRRAFNFSFWYAVLVAVLFTINNGMTSHSSRLQLATVAFVPVLALFIWNAFDNILNNRSAGFLAWGLSAGVLYGAMCLSSFYIAWFFGFYFLIFSFVLIFSIGRNKILAFGGGLREHRWPVFFVLIGGLVSLTPFVYAFLPKSRDVTLRTIEAVLSNTIPLEGILQVGVDNFLYGDFYNYILSVVSPGYGPSGEYYNMGISFGLFVLFVLASVRLFRGETFGMSDKTIYAMMVTTLLSWGAALNVFGLSAWYFVYYIVPGAKALNVVSAYQLVLVFPIIVVAVKYFSTRKVPLAFLVFVVFILVVGELNKPFLGFDRSAELERVKMPNAIPNECEVFYVSGWDGQGNLTAHPEWVNQYYAHNVSAMLISQLINVPTVNGVASFNMPDWDFGFPNNADYKDRVYNYAAKHDIANMCFLDLNTKIWSLN